MAAFLKVCFWTNIILSPTDVSQKPWGGNPGSVFASSCSWLLLPSMFPLGGKWHKLPPPFLVGFPVIRLAWLEAQVMCNHCCYVLAPIMWIAHLLFASTLKAYHEIIPGRWRLRANSGWQQSRQDPAQHANGSAWAWTGVCCHLHREARWGFFQVAPRVVPHNKNIPKHSSIQVPRHDI